MNLKKFLKNLSIAGIAAVAMAVGTAHATTSTTFYESFNGINGFNASGNLVLVGTDNMDGSFTITSGTGTEVVNGVTHTLNLIANPNGIPFATSPSGAFWFDNQLFPTSDPLLDVYGLLFASSTGFELNIWGNGVGAPYTYMMQNGRQMNVTFGATVPEPATLVLLGLGLIGVAMSRRRAGKNKTA